MGNARFDSTSYRSYSTTHNLEKASRAQVFTNRNLDPGLDPAKIVLRESCDSYVNPNSTPVILGLDVTGSMGFVAEAIAKKELPGLMEGIYMEKPISDPHLMFMGIGDIAHGFSGDTSPLQVSQFEAGAIELIEQLRKIYLESGGGGNGFESYDLAWYFAAHRTKIDSIDRGQKGFLFTIGDEPPPPAHGSLPYDRLARVFGSKDIPQPESRDELLKKVQEKYVVFHIVAEEGNHYSYSPNSVEGPWNEILGPNVIYMKDHTKLSAIVIATLKVAQGADINEVINASNDPATLRHAFKNALAHI